MYLGVCGAGTRERTASCVRVYDGSNAQVALGTCAFFHDIPDTTDECFEKPCQTCVWLLCACCCVHIVPHYRVCE